MLFYRARPGADCVATVGLSGATVRAVVGPRRCICSPFGDFAWSPRGDEIAVAEWLPTEESPKNAGIAFVRPDGSTVRPPLASRGIDLRWSPDGAMLAWSGADDRVHVASADGSDERTVPAVSPGEDLSPAWSHDGNDVAFVHCGRACDSIFGDIYVAPADGRTVPDRITRDGWDAEPAWSLDGRYLAVVHAFGKHRGRWRIDVVDVVSRLRRVFVRCTYECEDPAWSPDGVSLAYLGNYREGHVTTGPELRVVSANGEDDRPLALKFEQLRRTGTEVSFSWSPSGDRLAFEHLSNGDRDGKGGIFVVRSDGSGLRQLTREP